MKSKSWCIAVTAVYGNNENQLIPYESLARVLKALVSCFAWAQVIGRSTACRGQCLVSVRMVREPREAGLLGEVGY